MFFNVIFLMDILHQLEKWIGKPNYVHLFDVFNGCSTSIKQIDRLIWKGMSNIYYQEKLKFSELRFSREEHLKKCTKFEEQKCTRYIRGNVYICIIICSCLLSAILVLQIFSKLFCSGDKRLLSEYLRKWGWFQEHNNVPLNISAKN